MRKRKRLDVVEEFMPRGASIATGLLPLPGLPTERHRVVHEDVVIVNPTSDRLSRAMAHLAKQQPARKNPAWLRNFKAGVRETKDFYNGVDMGARKRGRADVERARIGASISARRRARQQDAPTVEMRRLDVRPKGQPRQLTDEQLLRAIDRGNVPPNVSAERITRVLRAHGATLLAHNPALVCTHCGDSPKARAMSETFHGTPSETARVRIGSRTRDVVDMGAVKAVSTNARGQITHLVYEPDVHSSRGGVEWDHASGDRGLPFGLGNSSAKPRLTARPGRGDHLVVDPATRRPELAGAGQLDLGNSPMRFDPRRGLVG